MAFLLIKKLTSVNSPFLCYRHNNLTCLTRLFQFSTQIQKKEDLPFMAQYLISSFSFPEDRAVKIASSPKFSAIKTQDRPDSVVHFFKDNGLTSREIKSLILWNPQLLASNVEKILKPRANELITSGFGGNIFIQLIKSNPNALSCRTTLSRLQFWRNFVGNSYENLLKVINRNVELMNVDIDKKIAPRMNLLRKYGLSEQQIAMVVMGTSLILKDLDDAKRLLEQTENLGFRRCSGMFVHGLMVVSSLSKDTLVRKMKFFRNTYNLSEEDIKLAVNKSPYILRLLEENVKVTMDFLIKEVGFDSRDVMLFPTLLTYSVEKRLKPRNYVINTLVSKGLQMCSFHTVAKMGEKTFVERFVDPYKEKMPELGDSYATLLMGKDA